MHPKFISSTLFFLFVSVSAHATLIAVDQFETVGTGSYNTGNISGQNPTIPTGFTGAWGAGNNATSHMEVESGGLTHALLPQSASGGNVFVRPQSNNDGRNRHRAFDSTAASTIGSSTELYFSALVQVGENPTTNFGPNWFGIGATPSASNATPSSGIYISYSGGTDGLRIWENGIYNNTTLVPTVDETYMVVVGIDFNDSQVTWDIFDQNDEISSPSFSGNFASTITQAQIVSLFVGHLSNNSGFSSNSDTPKFDEFRLGTTLGDVIAIPEPGTLALVGIALGSLLLFRRRR